MNKFLKIFFPALLILVMMLIQSRSTVLWVDFLMNQDFIIENLCENRTQPELECNGKCHLKSSFEKVAEEKEKAVFSIEEIRVLAFYEELQDFSIQDIYLTEPYNITSNDIVLDQTNVNGLFRPPIGTG